MRFLPYKWQDDEASLHKLAENYGDVRPLVPNIKDAYESYVTTKGSPYLKAIGLPQSVTNAFHRAYRSKNKNMGLCWIKAVLDHSLTACPMCGAGSATTVEHYLPKTPFPEFSVYSYNLLPSCSTCNSKRGAVNKNGVEHRLLHPFFDQAIYEKLRLTTNINFKKGVVKYALSFNRSAFSLTDIDRIEHHFEKCVNRKAFRSETSAFAKLAKQQVSRCRTSSRSKIKFQANLTDLEKIGSGNSWLAALYRGLLALKVADLDEFLTTANI